MDSRAGAERSAMSRERRATPHGMVYRHVHLGTINLEVGKASRTATKSVVRRLTGKFSRRP